MTECDHQEQVNYQAYIEEYEAKIKDVQDQLTKKESDFDNLVNQKMIMVSNKSKIESLKPQRNALKQKLSELKSTSDVIDLKEKLPSLICELYNEKLQ